MTMPGDGNRAALSCTVATLFQRAQRIWVGVCVGVCVATSACISKDQTTPDSIFAGVTWLRERIVSGISTPVRDTHNAHVDISLPWDAGVLRRSRLTFRVGVEGNPSGEWEALAGQIYKRDTHPFAHTSTFPPARSRRQRDNETSVL